MNALSVVLLWFPIIKEILERRIKLGSQLIVALDITWKCFGGNNSSQKLPQWKENNVLMVSVIYQKRALPIYWVLLEKNGSSNLAEQQQVLRPVVRLLKKYKLVIIASIGILNRL